jgi:hypothetical protein
VLARELEIAFKWIAKEQDVREWKGLICLITDTSGRLM